MQKLYGLKQFPSIDRLVAVFENRADAIAIAVNFKSIEDDKLDDYIVEIPYYEDTDRIKHEWKPCTITDIMNIADIIEAVDDKRRQYADNPL